MLQDSADHAAAPGAATCRCALPAARDAADGTGGVAARVADSSTGGVPARVAADGTGGVPARVADGSTVDAGRAADAASGIPKALRTCGLQNVVRKHLRAGRLSRVMRPWHVGGANRRK